MERYRLLDAWRGAAALAVVLFHCSNFVWPAGHSLATDALRAGWAGVFVFFPVSGYCVLAATHAAGGATLGAFLRRRWLRIFPPYWASVVLTVAVTLVALPFNHTAGHELRLGPGTAIAVATLTQTLVGAGGAVNVVYWSLCYEEQFYLVMALTLLLGGRKRAGALLAVTIVAFAYRVWLPDAVPGLFLQHWGSFAAGMAVYGFRHPAYGRAWSAAQLLLSAGSAALTRDPGAAVAVTAAVLFVALQPYDQPLSRSRWLRPLFAVGTFSYSLYLVHVPIGGRAVNLGRRFLPAPLLPLLGAAVSLAAGWLFYRLVERRTRSSSPPAVARP